jgi:hypothetical protein
MEIRVYQKILTVYSKSYKYIYADKDQAVDIKFKYNGKYYYLTIKNGIPVVIEAAQHARPHPLLPLN